MDLLHEIKQAEALPAYRVRVVFDTGESAVFDCSSYLDHPYWKRLADPAFFRLVRVSAGTLAWPDDIDIAPEDVWEKAVRGTTPPSEPYPDISAPPLFAAEPDPPPYTP